MYNMISGPAKIRSEKIKINKQAGAEQFLAQIQFGELEQTGNLTAGHPVKSSISEVVFLINLLPVFLSGVLPIR